MPTFCVILTALLLIAIAVWFGYVKPLMKDGKAARVLKEQVEANKAKQDREEAQRKHEADAAHKFQKDVLNILEGLVTGRLDTYRWERDQYGAKKPRDYEVVNLMRQLQALPTKVSNLEEHRSTNLKRHHDLVAQVKEVHDKLAPYA
jgi:hypothetical protein